MAEENTMLRTVEAQPDRAIELGYEGEKAATRVRFDCGEMAETFGAGEAELTVTIPGCGMSFMAEITQDGNSVLWEIDPMWTQQAGYGECQLNWFVGGTLAKSAVYMTHVKKSLGRGGKAQTPEPGYAESVRMAGRSARQAEEAANAAKLDANRAEAARDKGPVIGENGNWFVWDAAAGVYVDTGHFSGGTAPSIGANGNWFIGNEDSGVSATGPAGPTYFPAVSEDGVLSWSNNSGLPNPPPVKVTGPAYELTDADKQEIVAATLAALPKAEEASF